METIIDSAEYLVNYCCHMDSTHRSRAEYFGQWLRQKLKAKEMSQADLARATGKSKGVVGNWVRGERLPTPESCDFIADALRVNVDDVLDAAGHRDITVGFEHASDAVRRLQPYIDRVQWDEQKFAIATGVLTGLSIPASLDQED